jgi:hypothetical protein
MMIYTSGLASTELHFGVKFGVSVKLFIVRPMKMLWMKAFQSTKYQSGSQGPSSILRKTY